MASLDVFHQDIFREIALTTAVEKYPYKPTGIGELELFEDDPIRTTALAVEQRQGKLLLIPFSERGQEGTQRTTEERQARYFKVPRLMHSDTITAQEIQDIRQFGTESVLMQVQTEVARRLNGPTGLTSNIEFTWEYHRLAALNGQLMDANGSLKYDWFEEFGIERPTPITFNLKLNADGSAAAPNTVRPLCNGIVRAMARRSQGAFLPTTQVYALCGDEFWDALTNHPDVIKTFYNWQAAEELRKGQAFEAMRFGGINWFNYRGSDDATTIAVPTNSCRFFPRGAPGVFKRALAPGETFEWVNTPGKPLPASSPRNVAIDWDKHVLQGTEDVFGEPATYTPPGGTAIPINGIFDSAYTDQAEAAPLESNTVQPVFGVRLAQFPSPPVQNGALLVRGVGYIVKDIREAVAAQLVAKNTAGEFPTAAGASVFSPRDWASFNGQYPAIFVLSKSEDRASLGPNGAQQFTTTTEIVITARVVAKMLPNGAGALGAQLALEALKTEIDQVLVNNPVITPLIQQIAYVHTEISVNDNGTDHLAELEMHFGIEFYEGPEDFYPVEGVPITDVNVTLDAINRFDPNGTYPDPPFPSSVEPAPRTSGPDGRAEGGIDITLPQ
uniref:Minor tail protein n=1 Tax=Mycena chlorophos TaxID=658473 RepID=A0ABQ0KY16_MYCCL|nr:predicted protein [Mycena chlorophos]